MSTVKRLLPEQGAGPPRIAIFLSGSGSNAEQILRRVQSHTDAPVLEAAALVTDRPERSRARALGREFDVRVVENDIRAFYRERGADRVSVATPEGQRIRQAWTDVLRAQLAPLRIDFCVFAGFVPLTNLTNDYPCLNVHPGDLGYLKNGERYLVGLHTVPIERAILEGLEALRSSVILALPYTGAGGDMDAGPILGVSGPVPIDLADDDLETLRAVAAARPPERPRSGFRDRLEAVAQHNQEKLKRAGDWVVFPPVVFDFARGRFGQDKTGQLHYRIASRWHPVDTVVYGRDGQEIQFAAAAAGTDNRSMNPGARGRETSTQNESSAALRAMEDQQRITNNQ